jgi:hypothetical protein
MTHAAFADIARRIVPLFSGAGFVTIDELVDPVSDNGFVAMKSDGDDVVVRMVRDRKQWFVEMRSVTSDEWFDSRHVLAMIGDTQTWEPPTDEAALRAFVENLVMLAPQWRSLFNPNAYAKTKKELNARELMAARSFDDTPEN